MLRCAPLRICAVVCLLLGSTALGLSAPMHVGALPLVANPTATAAVTSSSSSTGSRLFVYPNKALIIRGGQQQLQSKIQASAIALTSVFTALGKTYASYLNTRPIITKSVTAGVIFTISDYLAQRFERGSTAGEEEHNKKPLVLDWTRLLTCGAVGLLYSGPTAHYWYDAVFQLVPGTSLIAALQKAALGQLIYGPAFTCVFFATSLMQAGNFSIGRWFQKIQQDLPAAWLAGIGFWPLVDLVSYSLISKAYIPLFVNLCSLVWTIYLSLIANRK